MKAATFALTTSVIVLSGCSTLGTHFNNAPDDFKLDDTPLVQAVIASDDEVETVTRTVEVERFTPIPMPGQLKPREIQGVTSTESHKKPHDIIDAAHAKSTVGPKSGAYVNAIQVYPFAKGALYQVYTAPEQVTDIALQPGERLISVSSGDTERWILGDTLSGEGLAEQVHILVKPIESGLTTNLVITTSQRAYHIELTSYRETYMAAVSWRYPQQSLISLSKERRARPRPIQSTLSMTETQPVLTDANAAFPTVLAVDALNFRYAIEGDDPHWRPLRAFDDGYKVYIQFPARLDQGEAPPLFVVGTDGDSQLVNYRVKGRYYVVDRLFGRAELRLGEKDQQVVRIDRVAS
ncbi:P-type conjugative transfer protein TrbG [Algimonas ampicilliniresistens]|uniref:P-type conjugative transfer protein TrbG n=1 Tax=Algimonas ampicilliniresistens TaxID=1298735 RepID=A0ABQ5V9Y1_9PROT|nr:P-type conjugative transfer protein TrbG [Algimonas ampicilliniresistens]GLQ23847.1 P-type conjugative transfer protein TrbG [Algimonas ampicilliniresistens]